ncbi:MAG: YkgJ family cysteine cluster protein [Planctomycetaceae bacterium]
MSEVQKVWYEDGLRFECTQCGYCCTGAPGVVWVNDEEIQAIAEYLEKPVGEIRLMHTRPYRNGVSLTEYANGDCVFFDGKTRRCTIYPVRPQQCRTWPFWNSNLKEPRDWEAAGRGCPGIGQGELVPLEVIRERAEVIDL